LAFRSERGAVTAEFMLITPVLILAVTALLGLFPLALSAIKLEFTAMQLARLHSLGLSVSAPAGYEIEIIERERFQCLVLRKEPLIMESEYCAIPIG
jgi:Flp pilus assembly protein TadG